MSAINYGDSKEDLGVCQSCQRIFAKNKWANERLLLRVIKEKLGITDEDLTSLDVVKQKLRDANIEEILN
jgi:hypothetical protein